MTLIWVAEIRGSRLCCSNPGHKFGLQDCGISVGGIDGLETTGAGSGTGGVATESTGIGSTGGTAITGASIRICQYETAIPRCQKRGMRSKRSVICAITKAPYTLSGDTNFIQIQSPPTNRRAATIVTTT